MSEHFKTEELTFSSTAVRLGIDNVPPTEVLPRLEEVCSSLEKVRTILGDNPVHIDSGYRCPPLNNAVHGAANSAHMDGWAADFICPDFGSPLEIVRALVEDRDLVFDQCIQEGKWVHISFDPRARRRVLTATFDANGNAHYSEGA